MGRELQEGEKLGEGSSSIMSFKEIWITIGELDFQVRSQRQRTQGCKTGPTLSMRVLN